MKNQDAQNQYQQQVKQYQSDQAARAQLNQQLQTQQDQLAKANNDLTAAKADQARLDALVAGAEAEQTRLQTPQTALQNEQVTAGSPEAAQRDADLGTVNAGLADVGKRLDGLYKSQTDAKAKVAQLTQTQAGAQQAVTDTQTRLSAITTQYPQAPSVTGTGPVSADKIAAGPDLLSDFFTNDSVKTAILQQMNKILAQDPKAPYLQTIRSSIDGYLQTIAQRLTLLRESADPNYDLYFMEVSASVEPSKQAKNHMARARWVFQESQIDWKGLANDLLNQRPDNDATRQSQMATLEAADVKTPADRLAAARKAVQELTAAANGTETGTSLSVLEEAKPYAFELSPAQGAVNVALSDVHDSRLSIVGIFSTLIGIGGGFNYQREHQIYGQFLEQNVYLAAQGKGSNVEFGWDYGPVPGASYTASGTFYDLRRSGGPQIHAPTQVQHQGRLDAEAGERGDGCPGVRAIECELLRPGAGERRGPGSADVVPPESKELQVIAARRQFLGKPITLRPRAGGRGNRGDYDGARVFRGDVDSRERYSSRTALAADRLDERKHHLYEGGYAATGNDGRKAPGDRIVRSDVAGIDHDAISHGGYVHRDSRNHGDLAAKVHSLERALSPN